MKNGIIYIGENLFETFFAISEEEQRLGLMNIDPPTPNMTFIYDSPKINKFWMKNTKASLDILFCNNGKVLRICKGEPYSTSIIGEDEYSDLVIELPLGTVASSNIKLGSPVGILSPKYSEFKNLVFKK